MKRWTVRFISFGIATLLAVLLCVRLGIWQLNRLEERRARNESVRAQSELPVLELGGLLGKDSAYVHYRKVRLKGVALYDRELVLAARSQAGGPGVQLLTPVRPADSLFGDTVVMLVRGFVFASDGRSYDQKLAREADSLDMDVLVTMFPTGRTGNVKLSDTISLRYANRDTIAEIIGAPVAPYVLLALGDTVPRIKGIPSRVPPPSLGEGPHFSYAMQWFGFALVFVIGFIAYTRAGTSSPPSDT